MSLRDTLVQLGFVMIAVGATVATWALLTGPLARWTKLGDRPPARRKRRPKTTPIDLVPPEEPESADESERASDPAAGPSPDNAFTDAPEDDPRT